MSRSISATSAPRLGIRRHLALASYWFGQFFLWQPVGTVLVQRQVDDLVPGDRQGTALGVVLGLGGLLAMVVPPLVGHFSDRLTTRFGRRRPIIVAGTVLAAAGLGVMATAGSLAQLAIGYLVVQLFFNAAGAAYAGLVPDVVPDAEFGRASGFLATMVQLGSGAGLAATAILAGPAFRWTYALIAAVILVSLIPTVVAARGEGLVALPPAVREAPAAAVRRFLAPLRSGDFAWVVYTRMLVTAAITTVVYFLFNFFRDVVGVARPDQFTPEWLLLVLLAAIPVGLAAGALSDRLGRKPFVYASGAVQAAVALFFILLFPTDQVLVLAVAVAYGIGYGCYYAVDWALACDTLPDRSRPAKDMGLFHVGFTLPQAFVPLVAGLALDAVNAGHPRQGYRLVFAFAVLFLALGTVLVSRVRGAR